MEKGIKTLLVVSNGHGEDIIASTVIKEILKEEPGIWIEALPLVGTGDAYSGLPVKILGPRRNMPSGGFARQSLKLLIQDLNAGLFSLTVEQGRTIKRAGADADLCLVVGDIYALFLGSKVNCPVIFMPTAKSEYISGHFRVEKRYMKKKADLVFPRDELTAKNLKDYGINAEYLGNVMMDTFNISGEPLFKEYSDAVIGILPGSRDDAYSNMIKILQSIDVIEGLTQKSISYGVALAGRLDFDHLVSLAQKEGWEPGKPEDIRGHQGKLTRQNVSVHFYRGRFGDLLDQADVFIGLAGTANEQACGMGKPVIAFPVEGAQYTEKFMKAQKKLLGDALAPVKSDPELVAAEVLVILNDSERYKKMAEAGKKRMGRPGGAALIARRIIEYLNK